MTADAQGYAEPQPWVRAVPQTDAERHLVAAALTVYRERRHQDADSMEAWDRVTNLVDDALVRPSLRADDRMGIVRS